MNKDNIFRKRILDLERMAFDKDIVTFTGFLNLYELHMVNSSRNEFPGITRGFFGGYEFAERQIVAFIPDALCYEWNYPIVCLKLIITGSKFVKKLSHRDYLGALIHLGIERNTIGDILVRQDSAFIFCQEHMADFIMENLHQVRSNSIRIETVTDPVSLPRPEFKDIQGTVSSLRLDSLIAIAFGESRSKLVREIEAGNVYVNGRLITSNGYTVEENDIISLRGKGRFKFKGRQGQTKKGRTVVFLQKYI